MRSVIASVLWLMLSLSALAAPAAERQESQSASLLTTESRFEKCRLTGADGDGNWTFHTAGGDVKSISARQIVRYGDFVPSITGHGVRLKTGGRLAAYSVVMDRTDLTVESDLIREPLALSRVAVGAIVFDEPADPARAQSLDKRIATAAANTHDTLLFTNGDQLSGDVVAIADDKVEFKTPQSEFSIERPRVRALVFSRDPAAPGRETSLRTWIGLRDGSRLLARKLIAKDDVTTIELEGAAQLSVDRDALVALQPVHGDAVYLSDLVDAGYRQIPFLSLPWDYQRDRNVTGGPLVCGGRLYLKGLGMHSAARITYEIPAGYRAFQSELAIDESAGPQGSVTCRVFTDDGSGKWQLKHESPVIRGQAPPADIDVALEGAKRISLLVDFADRGDVQDHLNWLDARLVR
jgi:hypothetical protein